MHRTLSDDGVPSQIIAFVSLFITIFITRRRRQWPSGGRSPPRRVLLLRRHGRLTHDNSDNNKNPDTSTRCYAVVRLVRARTMDTRRKKPYIVLDDFPTRSSSIPSFRKKPSPGH